jgi:hypothetical protein
LSNWLRLVISLLVTLVLTALAYLLPLTPLLYFFAPGFWLSNIIPEGMVNALGGFYFPIYASIVIWTLLFFWLLLLIARTRNRRRR